jgi:hypothetical protein
LAPGVDDDDYEAKPEDEKVRLQHQISGRAIAMDMTAGIFQLTPNCSHFARAACFRNSFLAILFFGDGVPPTTAERLMTPDR